MTGMRKADNQERCKADKEIAEREPVITWVRGKHGVWVHDEIDDPHADTSYPLRGAR